MDKPENLKELLELKRKLESVKGVESFTVNYAINKTLGRMKESISAAKKEEDKIVAIGKDFDREVKELISKMADGNKVTTPTGIVEQVPQEKMAEFRVKYNDLREKHKSAIDDREKELVKFQMFLEDTKVPDFEIYGIELKDCPANLNDEQTKGLFPILID